MAVVDYMLFRRMAATVLLQVFFWVSVVIILAAGAWYTMDALGSIRHEGAGGTLLRCLGIMAGCIFAVVLVRLMTEVAIVFFRINDTLTAIRNQKGP